MWKAGEQKGVGREGQKLTGAQDSGGEWTRADLVSSRRQSRVSKPPPAFVNTFMATQPHPLPVCGCSPAQTAGLKGTCHRDIMTHRLSEKMFASITKGCLHARKQVGKN